MLIIIIIYNVLWNGKILSSEKGRVFISQELVEFEDKNKTHARTFALSNRLVCIVLIISPRLISKDFAYNT